MQQSDKQKKYQMYEDTYYNNNLTEIENLVETEKNWNSDVDSSEKVHNEVMNVDHIVKTSKSEY